MGKTTIEHKRIVGVSNYSPIEIDAYIDKKFVRTTEPTSGADVLYTNKPISTNIPVVVIFNDQDWLKEWGVKVVDESKQISNELVDEWVGA